jgi:hypothetical protein
VMKGSSGSSVDRGRSVGGAPLVPRTGDGGGGGGALVQDVEN